ncbi:class I SAM-dependent methyltransferase [Chitinispirillales bacterium ANBcel5]|uniref:class I SAM-dependent methyltransferase n=1 Tax=Cellulosispirillum alkaliphilum TaxID=3039283 RepID=UPI002A53EEA2|nr:class I SAM-dependent methyltransferase [Chitinispirillales bacterium ANBcel5]
MYGTTHLAKNSFLKILSKTKRLISKSDHITVSGSVIPSPDRRWCGPEFKNDEYYLKSSENEARRLVEVLGCSENSKVLDVGCGQGRLPIGLLRIMSNLHYTGMDVNQKAIDWCNRYIAKSHPTFLFKHLDIYNERYNKQGKKTDEGYKLDTEDKSVDIVYLYSVFSHLEENDMRAYLSNFARVLKRDGKVFFTTFVEKDVPDITINPPDYRLKISGPLHIVRYNKDYLFSIVEEYGFSIIKFDHGLETDGQSGIYLKHS